MAVKRTKKHKQKTALKREETFSYSIKDNDLELLKKSSVVKKEVKKTSLPVGFNTSYVVKDLMKTLVVTLLVVGVLIAYTIYGQ